MSMRCCMMLSHRQTLSVGQLATLRLLLKEELKHPDFDSLKGFDGIVKGHKILQEKKEVGILIGGLSESIWSRQRTRKELEQHKDVDIMVIGNSTFSEFEEGVD